MALTKVSSSLVKDDAVTSAKIVDGGIATADIAANAVTSAKIAQNSILTKHIDDGQVTTDQLAADAVTSAKIADDAISEEHLDVTVITSLTEVTAATGDLLMVADISDSNNLKKIPVSSILAGTHTGAINTSGTVTSGAITASADISVVESNHAKLIVNSVGDYFPSVEIKRTSGSSKTNYQWHFQIGSSGFLNFKDITNGYYAAIFKNNGDIALSNDTDSTNPVLLLDKSAESATFAGTISSGAITSSAGITAETGLNLESGTLVIKNGTGDSSGLRIFQDSSDASKIYNNFNGTLQLGVGNTTALTIDSSENATFASTVTTPTLITGAYGASGSAGDGFRLNSTDLYGQVDASDKVRIAVAGDSFFNGGNVGIGATSPEAPLEIYKTVDGDAQNLLIMNQKSYGSGTGTNERASINLGIAEAGQNSLNRLFGTIHVRPYSESDSSSGIFSFGVRGTGAIRDDVLVLRGYSSTDQRVGIGTNSIDEKFQVEGGNIKIEAGAVSTNRGLIIANTGQTGNNTILEQYADGNPRGRLHTTERRLVIEAGSGGSTGTGEKLEFWTNASRAMTIDTSQNVGIGENSPTHKLHVAGTVKVTGTQTFDVDSGGGSYIAINHTGNESWTWGAQSGSGSDDYLDVGISGGTRAMSWHEDGRVGIGTTTPDGQLHVKGSTNKTLKLDPTFSSGTYTTLAFARNGTDKWRVFHPSDDSYLSFYNDQASAHQFSLKSDGKVGIGTTSPGATLHVDASGGANFQVSRTGVADMFYVEADGTNAVIRNPGSNDLVFQMGGTPEKMRIKNDGKVGIGTVSPGAKLEVSGKDDYGAGDLIRLIFDNSPADTGITFADINSTIKSRITMDAANTADLRVSSASQMHFYTGTSNGTTDPGNLTIDSSGYVGIGANPAFLGLTGSGTSRVLHVGGTNAQLRLTNSIIHHDNAGLTKLTIRNNYGATSNSAQMELQAGFITFETGTSFTERLRINHLGRQAYSGSATANAHGNFVGEVGTGYKALAFERTVGGGEVGSIVSNTSSTTYNTSSDYRLKENIDYTWDATTRLKQLKPARFNWIVDDTNTLVDGFLAHEVSSIVPEAIYGEKDGMTDPILYENGDEIPEGKSVGDVKTASVPDYQAIDHSKLVPLLVKTIQELEERLTAGGL